MNLTYPKRLALIGLTTTRLAHLRLYVPPARACNDNQNWSNGDWGNLGGDNGSRNACHRLADKVGSSWGIRQALLLAVASRPTDA